jgi:predicted DNA-binding WGR domain protein
MKTDMQSYLEKHDPAKNQARFYNMVILPNLFGEWTLYREWGRIGQGGQRHSLHCTWTYTVRGNFALFAVLVQRNTNNT